MSLLAELIAYQIAVAIKILLLRSKSSAQFELSSKNLLTFFNCLRGLAKVELVMKSGRG